MIMQLMIYAAADNAVGRDLRKQIRSTGFEIGAGTIYCTSLTALEQQLRKPLGKSPLGILIPSDDDELAALTSMRRLMRDMRLILILPDSHKPNIAHARAHMLRPRFITYADRYLEEVTAVLWKMKHAICATAV